MMLCYKLKANLFKLAPHRPATTLRCCLCVNASLVMTQKYNDMTLNGVIRYDFATIPPLLWREVMSQLVMQGIRKWRQQDDFIYLRNHLQADTGKQRVRPVDRQAVGHRYKLTRSEQKWVGSIFGGLIRKIGRISQIACLFFMAVIRAFGPNFPPLQNSTNRRETTDRRFRQKNQLSHYIQELYRCYNMTLMSFPALALSTLQ